MNAGRELDALIAEKVMKLYVDAGVMYAGYCPDSECCEGQPIPEYSTDIAAAWLVIEQLIAQKLWTQFTLIEHEGQWKVWDYHYGPEEDKDKDYLAAAPTAPLAICLAALKAVGTRHPVEAA